jgi:hypothetical protein
MYDFVACSSLLCIDEGALPTGVSLHRDRVPPAREPEVLVRFRCNIGNFSLLCWIWGSHRGDYEEYYCLLGCSAVWSGKNQPTFRRNMQCSSSESNGKPSKKPAKCRQQECEFQSHWEFRCISSLSPTFFVFSYSWVDRISVHHFNKNPPQSTAFCQMNLFLNTKPTFFRIIFKCYRTCSTVFWPPSSAECYMSVDRINYK